LGRPASDEPDAQGHHQPKAGGDGSHEQIGRHVFEHLRTDVTSEIPDRAAKSVSDL
jgi:hypothetical protein